MAEFSDYIVYVDESGDHDLAQANSPYPIFCLAFCVFKIETYVQIVVPTFQTFKFKYFGNDTVIFHERDVRRSIEAFAFLRSDKEKRQDFLQELTKQVSETDMDIIATVIDKTKLKNSYKNPYNPYEIALHLCMERLLIFLKKQGETNKTVFIVFECRGPTEDRDLEVTFLRICANENNWGYKRHDFSQFDFKCKFVSKAANSTGLQLADLTARPIGMSILRPEQKKPLLRSYLKKSGFKVLSIKQKAPEKILGLNVDWKKSCP